MGVVPGNHTSFVASTSGTSPGFGDTEETGDGQNRPGRRAAQTGDRRRAADQGHLLEEIGELAAQHPGRQAAQRRERPGEQIGLVRFAGHD